MRQHEIALADSAIATASLADLVSLSARHHAVVQDPEHAPDQDLSLQRQSVDLKPVQSDAVVLEIVLDFGLDEPYILVAYASAVQVPPCLQGSLP